MFQASASFRGKGRSPISYGAGRRALMEDGDHWPMKEWSLTPSEMTPRQMSPAPPQQSSELSGMTPKSPRPPAVNETRRHRLKLTVLRCELQSPESPAFGLGFFGPEGLATQVSRPLLAPPAPSPGRIQRYRHNITLWAGLDLPLA
jgi:hypothetical protein